MSHSFSLFEWMFEPLPLRDPDVARCGVHVSSGWFLFHQECRREGRVPSLSAYLAESLRRTLYEPNAFFFRVGKVNRRGLPYLETRATRRRAAERDRVFRDRWAVPEGESTEEARQRVYSGGKSITVPLNFREDT